MTRSKYTKTVLRLQELSKLINDLKSINIIGLDTIMKKYESSEFYSDLQTLLIRRSAFQTILVKYVAARTLLLKELNSASSIDEDEVNNIIDSEQKQEVVIEQEETIEEVVIKKKSKKGKK